MTLFDSLKLISHLKILNLVIKDQHLFQRSGWFALILSQMFATFPKHPNFLFPADGEREINQEAYCFHVQCSPAICSQ